VTRRLTVEWPDPGPFDDRNGSPIRLLVASDAPDPALEHAVNHDRLGHIDAILGCGDLEPDYLGFLADAFGSPLVYVRGNHDRGGPWSGTPRPAPTPLASGHPITVAGITVVPLEWPGLGLEGAQRDELRAWLDVLRAEARLLVRRLLGRNGPLLIVSHAPPRGVGDAASDPYHVGYGAYRWFLDRHRPPLWLHGHTTPASVRDWRDRRGPSTVANATGSVVVDLVAPGGAATADTRRNESAVA
jgi:hypothetical protein